MEEITTKAALCPKCGKYHLIASLEQFNSNIETRKEFAKLLIDKFEVIYVTTQNAKDNFGYCQE